jgi:hypothetical protein
MNTEAPKIKWSDFTGSFVLAAISFVIAAFFIYMAYVGMETGTALKIKGYPRSVPHGRGELQYGGVFTREENPWRFWFVETAYATCAILFIIGGFQPLREIYNEYRQQKITPTPHPKTH